MATRTARPAQQPSKPGRSRRSSAAAPPDPAAAREPEPLQRYAAKRDFERTPEPRPTRARRPKKLSFVIQKHWATRLHYDLRLEWGGVMLSWAVPKGPCFDPQEKRVAIHVEDHPVDYNRFEGTIPAKQYGAGDVIIWDRGTWEPDGDVQAGLAEGKLLFRLRGEKLAGLWELVRIAKPGDKQDPWILFKKRDEWAKPLADYDVISALPDSVVDRPLGLLEERTARPFERPNLNHHADAGQPDPSRMPGAVRAALPDGLAPQLATAARELPRRGDWHYELKFDGYRMLARFDAGGDVRLYTRNDNDWTDRLQPLARSLKALRWKNSWLDGEIVVLGDKGIPDFHRLQTAFDTRNPRDIDYFVFDLPWFDGFDLRAAPLAARRELLRRLLDARAAEHVRYSADFVAEPAQILQSARELGLEGIMAKRADAPYVSRRSDSWLKLKCHNEQEFVIGGFVDRSGSRTEVGSLLLGVYDGDTLQYVGNVGTGWDGATGAQLHRRLVQIESAKSPFATPVVPTGRWSRRPGGNERWVRPELVAQVRYGEWTPRGHIRHPTFVGLREDKPAREVTREPQARNDQPQAGHGTGAAATAAPASALPSSRVVRIKISNPDRVIDAASGLKKIDLVRYYDSVAERMLPHLQGRPVSLVRNPQGVGGESFFQKHADKAAFPGLRELDPALFPEHPPLLEVPNADALVAAAQMNVIEFHTWNSTVKAIDKPDRVIFDLDPGEGVAWPRMQEAATLTRELLRELGLASWLKTSGGKGLHVVVPLAPKLDYDTVKDFAQAVVLHLANTLPTRFVAKSGAANRVGRIFVDYLRNTQGATTAAAFSARARPGLGVSMPVAWEQLSGLKSAAQWSVANAREHLSFEKVDPWAEYWKSRQTLAGAMKRLGMKVPPRR